MNSTVNGSSCSVSLNPTAQKIEEPFAYCLIFVVSLVGNSFIGIIVYKTQTLRKPINSDFYCQHGRARLAVLNIRNPAESNISVREL